MKKKLMRVLVVLAVFALCTSYVSDGANNGQAMNADKVNRYASAAVVL